MSCSQNPGVALLYLGVASLYPGLRLFDYFPGALPQQVIP
jgi:hypothetical protein